MKATTEQTLTPETLAREFAAILKTWLTPDEQKQVVERNAGYVGTEYENCCATGDFCDSNMAMSEAMEKLGINPDEAKTWGEFTHDELWNSAWDIAKKNGFWFANS